MLEHGQRIVALEGRRRSRLVPALLPLLDGTRTVDEIVGMLGEPARPAVENVLARPRATHGLLVDGPPLADDEPRPVRRDRRRCSRRSTPAAERSPTRSGAPGCSVGVAGARRAGVGGRRASCARAASRVELADGPAAGVDLTSALRPRRAAAASGLERAGPRGRAPVAPGPARSTGVRRGRPALPPGRHVLLRVLPASARRQPRRGRRAAAARGRARRVSRPPRRSMRSPARSPRSSRSAGSCSATTTRRRRSTRSSSCRRSR